LMRAKPLVFDNNDEEQMEIKNENVQEPLTNEAGCSNDHHFRRGKTAIAEGQNKCAVAVKEARSNKSVPVLAVGQCAMLKIPTVDHGLADPRNLLLITCVTKKLCLAKLVVFYRIPFRVLAKKAAKESEGKCKKKFLYHWINGRHVETLDKQRHATLCLNVHMIILKNSLEQFELDMKSDMVALVTDSAFVMKKIGRLLGIKH
ncbi:hypothetical protein T11_10916, partial [Trichinella zimbabwensis]